MLRKFEGIKLQSLPLSSAYCVVNTLYENIKLNAVAVSGAVLKRLEG